MLVSVSLDECLFLFVERIDLICILWCFLFFDLKVEVVVKLFCIIVINVVV